MSERITEKCSRPASDFEIVACVPSKLIAGASVDVRGLYRCPRCSHALDRLGHGERVVCIECNLGVTLHGNGFTLDGRALA